MSDRNVLHDRPNDTEILVIDDTLTNLEVVSDILSSAHYNISAVTSGQRALKQVQRKAPALILLDIQMPEMDGFETCRQIKANPDTANIPIIFITALSDPDSIAEGFSLGGVDYITKPFREAELLARVRTHLSLHLLTERLEEQVRHRTAELQIALEQVQHSQLQLVQNEKMAGLGNLVAGVAHEINNPIGFLHGSVNNVKDYVKDLSEHLAIYHHHQPPTGPVQENAEEIDLAFLLDDLPKLLAAMTSATNRVKDISTSLRTFSRSDTACQASVDLHEGLDSTLLILKYRLKANELRPDIQVTRNYGDLPAIACFPGQLNQVFMNIIANAIDMFDEMAQQTTFEDLKHNPQHIEIRTALRPADRAVEICIRDNGKGIPEAIKPKIFDHLFTTKAVSKGTGLGLAIARQIVVEKHGGHLNVQSELGQGTEFSLQLPVRDSYYCG